MNNNHKDRKHDRIDENEIRDSHSRDRPTETLTSSRGEQGESDLNDREMESAGTTRTRRGVGE